MNEEEKKALVQQLDVRFGSDIFDLSSVFDVEYELLHKKNELLGSASTPDKDEPTKLAAALKKVESNTKQIAALKEKSDIFKSKVDNFLSKHKPLQSELIKQFEAIHKLEGVLSYLKSYEKIEEISNVLKQCNDDEQAVLLYAELKAMCAEHSEGHRATYMREYTHYWHNVLKDRLTMQYEEILRSLKWPFSSKQDSSTLPKDILNKFVICTRYLLSIEEPKGVSVVTSITDDFSQASEASLPVKVLLRPLKKRFAFHFTGSRQTARIDRPEWFLTQTLTWIKHHQEFIRKQVQRVIDDHNVKRINAEDEFNAGLIAMAAERLHTVLGLYHAQGLKGEMIDEDAAFAHAVDEALGFHKELVIITGQEANSVLSVLTRAETFVKWLAVEKKYALAKMDETLSSNQWMESVSSVGGATKSPRGADWMIALLATIEQRYSALPRPGHRLQFLELQLELIEEWRIRLTQILSAGAATLAEDSFVSPGAPHPLVAVINAAHHTRGVLLQWATSLHYLQLHYYRRQFQHFTQSQHRDPDDDDLYADTIPHIVQDIDTSLTLKDIEEKAQKLAMNEMFRRVPSDASEGQTAEGTEHNDTSRSKSGTESAYAETEEKVEGGGGVFGDAPALLGRLRDAGLLALHSHIIMEAKATLRDYRKQKWHAMTVVEQMALSISPPLCRPLAGLCARLHTAQATLAPSLYARLRTNIASDIDTYIFEEVVLENWWNTGGTMQFTHDVKRNIVPAFATPSKVALNANFMPKLLEACKILNLDYEEAMRLRYALIKNPHEPDLSKMRIRHVQPQEVLQILNQRTDLTEAFSLPSVLGTF